MWLLVARQPVQDAEFWPGRDLLASADAVAWPLFWIWMVHQVPGQGGLVVPMVTALAVLSALRRVQCALWVDHRYRFTTWRWGKVLGSMLLIGLVLKLLIGAA